MFFEGKDSVHQTMRRVAQKLEESGIPYAVVGGMALVAHGYERTTRDVDVLLTSEGLEAFRQQFVGKSYDPAPQRTRRFVDRVNGVTIDVLVTGLYPGSGRPGPIAYPDPTAVNETIDSIRVVCFETLVELKLAAGRHRDFGDVVELIRIHDLDESFAARLPPSLRADYVECLEEKRREEEYQAREG